MSDLKTITTEDGSITLFSKKYNSTYHSTHGALQESTHIFIIHALDYYYKSNNSKTIKILEYGMGTGLNILLALKYSIEQNIKIDFCTIEKHPISKSLLNSLEISNLFSTELVNYFHDIHAKPWGKSNYITSNFALTKHKNDFRDFEVNEKFDVIFYDCFGPGSQPQFWEVPFLEIVKSKMSKDAILTTFCAKGSFKRALKSLNLKVEALPGPPGKREITRATLTNNY